MPQWRQTIPPTAQPSKYINTLERERERERERESAQWNLDSKGHYMVHLEELRTQSGRQSSQSFSFYITVVLKPLLLGDFILRFPKLISSGELGFRNQTCLASNQQHCISVNCFPWIICMKCLSQLDRTSHWTLCLLKPKQPTEYKDDSAVEPWDRESERNLTDLVGGQTSTLN